MTKSNLKGKQASRVTQPRKSAAARRSLPKARSKSSANAGSLANGGANARTATLKSASPQVDRRIRSLGGWRAETLAEIRRIIRKADPDIVEECKWIKPTNPLGVPVWSHAGIICTGEAYKQVVKLTFAKGASLDDPRGLFNSSLEGQTRRAIDIREGETLDAEALAALIQAAVAENLRAGAAKRKPSSKAVAKLMPTARKPKPVKLLSGGNPQIAKADGDAPVQAYIAAIPGWKRDIAKRLDAVIERSVPGVRKAVKWNSPFYGVEGQGWFLNFHCYTNYIKMAFFRGKSLRPVPPGESKQKEVRYLDIREDDQLDESQLARWVKQAAALPGWMS